MEHELLNTYPVLVEKPGEIVAHFKMTVLIVENRTMAVTGLPLDVTHFKSDKKIEDEEINKLLAVFLLFDKSLNIDFNWKMLY